MKRKIKIAIRVVVAIVVLLGFVLLIVRYVDIPGTKWDNFLDLRALIKWELKLRAR